MQKHESEERPPSGTNLPLGRHVERSEAGWLLRLPVRAEHITLEKRVIVAEEVLVRRQQVRETVRLGDTLKREELRIGTEGDAREPAVADAEAPTRQAGTRHGGSQR